MCLICVEWEMGRMTGQEALSAIQEQKTPDDSFEQRHLERLKDEIEAIGF